jgi:hypothetical protein
MYHTILNWRLAADTLEVLLDGQPQTDRWVAVRNAAIRGVRRELGWSLIEDGPRPVLDAGGGKLAVLLHPLDAADAHLRGRMQTAHGPATPVDIFNFNLRPGEVHRRI